MQLAEELDRAAPPFPVGVGLEGAVAHQAWREARARVLGLLAGERRGIVALIGPAGTGKTLLLRELARTLRAEGRPARFVERPDLHDPGSPGGNGVLLIDEAGRMDDGALHGLHAGGPACVLAGLPPLADRLRDQGIPAEIVELPPMGVDEVARFVAARLATAGQRRDLISPGAILELAAQSGGIPRLVNMLAGTAVFLASLEDASEVESRHVLDAASLRAGEQVHPQAAVPGAPPRGGPPAPEPAQARARDQPAPAAPAARPLAPERTRQEISNPALAGRAAPRPGSARRRGAWIAGAFCLAAAGLWLLPGAPRRSDAPMAEAASPAPVVQPTPPRAPAVVEAPPVPAPLPPPAPASDPAPQTQPRGRVAEADSRPAPVLPQLRDVPPPPDMVQPLSPAGLAPAPPRVVVHAQPGGSMQQAGRMASALEREFGAVELRAVVAVPRAPTIRYFHAEDGMTARRLAAALGGGGEGWRVQHLAGFRPLPRRGTVEVWMP